MGHLYDSLVIQTGLPQNLIGQDHDLKDAFYRLGHKFIMSPEPPKQALVDFVILNESQYWTWSPGGLFHEPPPPNWKSFFSGAQPIATWVHDPFLNFQKEAVVAGDSEVVLVSQKPWLDKFKEINPNSVFLNAAAINMNLMLPESVGIEEEYDVGFVGAVSHPYYADRKRLLDNLRDAGLKVFVHDSSTQPPLYRQDMIAAYSKCKIIFNYIRPDTQGTGNARIYEAITARKLLLTNKLPGIYDLGFEPQVHYAEYSTDEECVRLAKYYAECEDERRILAERAVAYGVEHHSWESRAKAILETMGPVVE